jgi:hypothetical protein
MLVISTEWTVVCCNKYRLQVCRTFYLLEMGSTFISPENFLYLHSLNTHLSEVQIIAQYLLITGVLDTEMCVLILTLFIPVYTD